MQSAESVLQEQDTPERSEQLQVQSNLQKDKRLPVAQVVVPIPKCHACSISELPTEMTNPVSYTFDNGQIAWFCNVDEMNKWKNQYNRE